MDGTISQLTLAQDEGRTMTTRMTAARSLFHWHMPARFRGRARLRARVAELERWRQAQEEAWSAFEDGKRAIAASHGPRPGKGPGQQLATVPGTLTVITDAAMVPGDEPLPVPAAMWFWLRVHVLYWRDGWPIISTRERRNNEVARALCTAAQFSELTGHRWAPGPAGGDLA